MQPAPLHNGMHGGGGSSTANKSKGGGGGSVFGAMGSKQFSMGSFPGVSGRIKEATAAPAALLEQMSMVGGLAVLH